MSRKSKDRRTQRQTDTMFFSARGNFKPTPLAPHKTAPFKRRVKCHCLKQASITADIVKCKAAHEGEEGV